jgi:hypothetical protein
MPEPMTLPTNDCMSLSFNLTCLSARTSSALTKRAPPDLNRYGQKYARAAHPSAGRCPEQALRTARRRGSLQRKVS